METITAYFGQQGILGIIVLMLIGVIVWQQRRIDSKDKQITELQDKRVGDSNQYSSNFIEVTKEGVMTSKDSLVALSLLQRSVDSLAVAFQKLLDRK